MPTCYDKYNKKFLVHSTFIINLHIQLYHSDNFTTNIENIIYRNKKNERSFPFHHGILPCHILTFSPAYKSSAKLNT